MPPIVNKPIVKINISLSKNIWTPPVDKVLGISERVALETGIPIETIQKIMWCESRYKNDAVNENKKDGKVWSSDFGAFQLNDFYHKKTALGMGLDIHNPTDNATYAIHLLNTQGLAPWSASKTCRDHA